jgi:hypothetical protein
LVCASQLEAEAKVEEIEEACLASHLYLYPNSPLAQYLYDKWCVRWTVQGDFAPVAVAPTSQPAPSPSPTPTPSDRWFTPLKLGSSLIGYSATTAGQWVDPNTGTPLPVRRLLDETYQNAAGQKVSQYGISV